MAPMYLIHTAGDMTANGQHCRDCGLLLAGPGFHPWHVGAQVANADNFWVDTAAVTDDHTFVKECAPCNARTN